MVAWSVLCRHCTRIASCFLSCLSREALVLSPGSCLLQEPLWRRGSLSGVSVAAKASLAAEMSQQPALETPEGDRCSFPRNLARGTFGGDVNCLQQLLAHEGFLTLEEPSGFFGAHTEDALRRWQAANGLAAESVFSLPARALYAQKRGLPLPDSGRIFADGDAAGAGGRTCVDVCAEFAGIQDCQTRCVRDAKDKKFACRDACQLAFSTACDRAFPPSVEGGSANYAVCLQYLDTACEDACASFETAPRRPAA